jgi:hypothetical protein
VRTKRAHKCSFLSQVMTGSSQAGAPSLKVKEERDEEVGTGDLVDEVLGMGEEQVR